MSILMCLVTKRLEPRSCRRLVNAIVVVAGLLGGVACGESPTAIQLADPCDKGLSIAPDRGAIALGGSVRLRATSSSGAPCRLRVRWTGSPSGIITVQPLPDSAHVALITGVTEG